MYVFTFQYKQSNIVHSMLLLLLYGLRIDRGIIMSNENNNKKNIEQQTQNKCWLEKLLGFNPTYNLTFISGILFIVLFVLFINVNYVYANDTNLIQGNINLNKQTSKNLYKGHFVKLPKVKEDYVHISSTLLPNGNVLLIQDFNVLLFDSINNIFAELKKQTTLSMAINKPAQAMLMRDNNVLFIGTLENNQKPEIYNTEKDTFELYDDSDLPYKYFERDKNKILGAKYYIISNDKLFLYYRKKEDGIPYNEFYLYDYINKTYKKINYDSDKYGNISKIIPHNDKLLIFNCYTKLIEYSLTENAVTSVKKLPFSHPYNIVKLDNKMFFFTKGNHYRENEREKLNLDGSPVFVMNLDTNEITQKGSLKGAGGAEYVILKDNRIMFNSGRFNGKYVNYEIYDTTTNKSTFTEPMVWHPNTSFTLLNDGSVLIVGGRLIETAFHAIKKTYRYYPDYNVKK